MPGTFYDFFILWFFYKSVSGILPDLRARELFYQRPDRQNGHILKFDNIRYLSVKEIVIAFRTDNSEEFGIKDNVHLHRGTVVQLKLTV